MLLPEARLETLIGQLRALPAGDRRAILARLSPGERDRIVAGLRGRPDKPARRTSPYSEDIDARIVARDAAPMTEAGRAALAAAVTVAGAAPEKAGESLADAFAGLLRRGDSR